MPTDQWVDLPSKATEEWHDIPPVEKRPVVAGNDPSVAMAISNVDHDPLPPSLSSLLKSGLGSYTTHMANVAKTATGGALDITKSIDPNNEHPVAALTGTLEGAGGPLMAGGALAGPKLAPLVQGASTALQHPVYGSVLKHFLGTALGTAVGSTALIKLLKGSHQE